MDGPADAGSETGSDSGSMPAASCADYCAAFKANCGSTKWAYPDDATCMGTCTALPLGGPVGLDQSMATISCRQYHAGAAAGSAQNMTTHCPHASAFGGGVCGGPMSDCDALCTIAGKICTGMNAPFADYNECSAKCKAWATNGMVGDQTGNTLQCREYHMLAAVTGPGTHCPHVKDVSATCQ